MSRWAEGYVRGLVCPKCGGEKSYAAWKCWRCANHKHDPTLKAECPRCHRLFVRRGDGRPAMHKVKGNEWCGDPEQTQRYPHGHPYHKHYSPIRKDAR